MPLEIKRIYFSESELRKALVNFSVLKKNFLELEDIKKIEIKASDTISVSMLVDKALAKEVKNVSFNHSEVAAALFAFCMVSKIPLPRRGKKSLHSTDDKIFLTIELDEDVNFDQYVISDVIGNASGVRKQ